MVSAEFAHDEKRDWGFFRSAARDIFWPHVEEEYRAELNGIAEGVKARGSKLDLWDIVALNSWLEVTYYTKQLNHKTGGTGGPLQRLRGHRQLHGGWARGDRPQ